MDIEDGLAKIKAGRPDAVVMVGTYAPLAKFVREAKKAGLTKTFFHTVSFVGPEAFAKDLGDASDRVMVTQVVPPYDVSKLTIVQEYKANLKKYYPKETPNFVSLEGYINAAVLTEGIRRAGKDLTREKLIDAIETIKAGQMGTGLGINYGPDDHVGIDKVYITRIKAGKYVEVGNWSDFK